MTKEQRDALAMIVDGFRVTVEHSDHLDHWLAGYFDTDVATARQKALAALKPAHDGMYPRLARAERRERRTTRTKQPAVEAWSAE